MFSVEDTLHLEDEESVSLRYILNISLSIFFTCMIAPARILALPRDCVSSTGARVLPIPVLDEVCLFKSVIVRQMLQRGVYLFREALMFLHIYIHTRKLGHKCSREGVYVFREVFMFLHIYTHTN